MAQARVLKTGSKDVKALEEYYQAEDYYLGKGDERFQLKLDGEIAEQLGIKGVPDKETWNQVCKGNFGKEGVLWNGKGEHRIGMDIGFSAPKSFSVAALVHGDDRLINVHKMAIEEAKRVYENECIVARYGHGGERWEQTGQALFAHVTHVSSRNQEPQLHEHLLILNVTRGEDGQLRKMENRLVIEKQRLLGEVYYQKLVEGAKELGYDVEWRKSLNGNALQPELACITPEQCAAFASRSKEIEAFVKDRYGVGLQEATNPQRQAAALATRKQKESTDLTALRKIWKEQANDLGVQVETWNGVATTYEKEDVKKAVEDALGHFTERESAAQESQLLSKAMVFGREKGLRYNDILSEYENMKRDGKILEKRGLRANKLVTDPVTLSRETRLIELVKNGKNKVEPVDTAENVISVLANTGLSEEQREVAAFLLATKDRVVGVNGYAGAGKTTTLKPVVETLKERGYDVVGLAPSHKAVEAMGDAGISGQTMQSFIFETNWKKNAEKLGKNSVIVLDEAGMVSTKDMLSVLRMAEQRGARVILSGDVKQHQSVEAGPAFRIVQKLAGGETKYIKTIIRQVNAEKEVKESLVNVAEDAKTAASMLDKHGLIKEVKDKEALQETVANEYVGKTQAGIDTAVITETNEDRIAINKRIREKLFGEDKEEKTLNVFRVKNITAAEKQNRLSYKDTTHVRFQKDYDRLGVEAGEVFKVRYWIDDHRAELVSDKGKEVTLNIQKFRKFEVGNMEEMKVCVGEKIKVTDNSLLDKAGLTNGMTGTVTGFGEKTMHVEIEGRKTSLNYNSAPVDYRYAGTGHSTQGKTVEHEILVRDPKVSEARSFYTDVTRTKKSASVYTTDKDMFLEKLGVTKEKHVARDVFKVKKHKERSMA